MSRNGGNARKMGRMDKRMHYPRTKGPQTQDNIHSRTRVGNTFTQTPKDLQDIRENSELTKITRGRPEIETWLNQEYTEKDSEIELGNLALQKAHGDDGIPGETYKSTRRWAAASITKIMNLIISGQPIPEKWTEGGNSIHLQK